MFAVTHSRPVRSCHSYPRYCRKHSLWYKMHCWPAGIADMCVVDCVVLLIMAGITQVLSAHPLVGWGLHETAASPCLRRYCTAGGSVLPMALKANYGGMCTRESCTPRGSTSSRLVRVWCMVSSSPFPCCPWSRGSLNGFSSASAPYGPTDSAFPACAFNDAMLKYCDQIAWSGELHDWSCNVAARHRKWASCESQGVPSQYVPP